MNLCWPNKILVHTLVYVALTWSVALIYNLYLNTHSKYRYYVDNDADFMLRFDAYVNESLDAVRHIDEWTLMYGIDKPIFSSAPTDLSQSTLCVGIITKERRGHYVYPAQIAASLLTRTKLSYQDRVLITFVNVDEAPSHDLLRVEHLISIVNIGSQAWVRRKS